MDARPLPSSSATRSGTSRPAARLDIPCIGLACGGTSAAELTEAGAVETYQDPAGLLSDLENSAIAQLLHQAH